MFSMHMRLVFTCPVVSGRVTGQKRKRVEEGAAAMERILIHDDDSSDIQPRNTHCYPSLSITLTVIHHHHYSPQHSPVLADSATGDAQSTRATVPEHFEYSQAGVLCPSSFDDFTKCTLAAHMKVAGGILAEKYRTPSLRGAVAECTRLWYTSSEGEELEILDHMGWNGAVQGRRVVVWGVLRLSKAKRRGLRAELARDNPVEYNKTQATQAAGAAQLKAGLLDSVRKVLAVRGCRAPDRGEDVYGVRVEVGQGW